MPFRFVATRRHVLAGGAAAVLTMAVGLVGPGALAADDKLVVVTSFPTEITAAYKNAFEKEYPGIKVEMLKKKTSAGIQYVRETAADNRSDLFWASAPDAFEVLKKDSLLEKYQPTVAGLPDKIGSFSINDPEGYYLGFAAAGYGIMWNTRYLQVKKLDAPQEWSDLAKPEYFRHVGISAPSQSGTTHLTVETILQGEGWEKGWKTLKEMGGNLKTVTERSFGVPDGVNSGDFGIGVVIDFFALSSQASGFPVEFRYPSVTTVVPANVALIKNAPNKDAAGKFIDFMLSEKGQELLLDPKIRRLPINPAVYAKAPEGYPNPFTDARLGKGVPFDTLQSEKRYELVNSLYDIMITYRLKDLQAATLAIHEAEAALAKKPNPEAAKLIADARAAIAALPIDGAASLKDDYTAAFTGKKTEGKSVGRQAEIEQEWDAFTVANYRKALDLADKAKAQLAK